MSDKDQCYRPDRHDDRCRCRGGMHILHAKDDRHPGCRCENCIGLELSTFSQQGEKE